MKTKITQILVIVSIFFANFTYGQFEKFSTFVQPYLSNDSIQNGFYYFATNNSNQGVLPSNQFLPGEVFQQFKSQYGDVNDKMVLKSKHTDNLTHYTHYRYQQYYKGIPVEGSFYNEHFTANGELSFINAKVADSINQSQIANLDKLEAIQVLIEHIFSVYQQQGEKVEFAWEDSLWEEQIQRDWGDSTATWYPYAATKLIWSIDSIANMGMIIQGNRYTLAYKIPIKIIAPVFKTVIYYVNANTGSVLKSHSAAFDNGPANIYVYGTKIIDTRWKGGLFGGHFYLRSNDNTRAVWTKRGPATGGGIWGLLSNIKDDDDQWHTNHRNETTAHYNVCTVWDFYRQRFGRIGMDDNGAEIRVKTDWDNFNAQYRHPTPLSPNNRIVFGMGNGISLGDDPSIAGHEYTHGITWHTSELAPSGESGALNESYSDIFGIIFQAMMYDNGNTDWIIINTISGLSSIERSLKDPHSSASPQPDTYQGQYWDNSGEVHTNDGVQNYWFYLLAQGGYGQNDNGDNYYIANGIGMYKAANIAYLALTSILGPSSQYINSRQATITAARKLYGKCSIPYNKVIRAWWAVGIGNKNTCSKPSGIKTFTKLNIQVYPNPANNHITIDIPVQTISPINIVGLTGNIVKTVNPHSLHFKVNVSNLSTGIYFVNFDFRNSHVVKKIVVQ